MFENRILLSNLTYDIHKNIIYFYNAFNHKKRK